MPPSPVLLPEHDPEQSTHNDSGRGGRTKNRTAAPVNRLAAPSEFCHFVLGGVNRSGLAPLHQRCRIVAKNAKGELRKVGQGRKRLHALLDSKPHATLGDGACGCGGTVCPFPAGAAFSVRRRLRFTYARRATMP